MTPRILNKYYFSSFLLELSGLVGSRLYGSTFNGSRCNGSTFDGLKVWDKNPKVTNNQINNCLVQHLPAGGACFRCFNDVIN